MVLAWVPPLNKGLLNGLELVECSRQESLLDRFKAGSYNLADDKLVGSISFIHFLYIQVVLRIFLTIVTKVESLSGLDAAAKPCAKIVVVNSGVKVGGFNLDQNFEQRVVKLLLPTCSEELSDFFRRYVTDVFLIDLKPSLPYRVKIISDLLFQLLV